MTRFARAKGSKSFNLKAPEDSTPWEVMKEHMMRAKQDNEEAKKREEAEQQRIENYNNFLKEHRVRKRKASWCEFPESQSSTEPTVGSIQKNKKNKEKINETSTVDSQEVKNKKNRSKKKIKIDQTIASVINNVNDISQQMHPNSQQKEKHEQSIPQNNEHTIVTNDQADSPKKEKKNRKKRKKSNKPLETSKIENSNVEDSKIDHSTPGNTPASNIIKNNNHVNKRQIIKEKKKFKKNEQPNRRKPINEQSFQLIINGKEVELVRYDGFPIMKKDAERLDELKNNMIKKGIPKSEVQRTMKLERRRAEKALARIKRDVCYNCRKGGHNLSDCPDLKSNLPGVEAAEGLCFKCGSTEHRQFECKVQRDKEFRFATCFICKESGHIARQCPDNPKGLYPNGGCCKLCGDVTHLRKDCPTVQTKKEETSIKLQTLNDDNIEDIGQQTKAVSQETVKKPKKIKF